MKKTWIKVKRGLLEPKHRDALGIRIWLYLYMVDRANWELGKVIEWVDGAEADELQMPIRTLREQRRQLEADGYVTCEQMQHGQQVTINNWTDPRRYDGEVLNVGGKNLEPPDVAQGDIQGYTQGSIKHGTPTYSSHDTNHKDSAAKRRQPTKADILKSELEKAFSQVTGLPIPPRRTARQAKEAAVRWWNPLLEIGGWFENDVDKAKAHISAVSAAMRSEGLTLSAPQSILEVARSRFAEMTVGKTNTGQETPEDFLRRLRSG